MRTDGSARRTIYSKDVEGPNSIAFDQQNKLIYFIDNWLSSLNVVDLEGHNAKMLLKDPILRVANSLEIFDKKIQFCGYESDSTFTVDHFSPDVRDLIHYRLCRVLHRSSKPSTVINLCERSNCEFLCLPRNDLKSYVCTCSSFYKLGPDKHTCLLSDLNEKIERKVSSIVRIFCLLVIIILAIGGFLFPKYAIR